MPINSRSLRNVFIQPVKEEGLFGLKEIDFRKFFSIFMGVWAMKNVGQLEIIFLLTIK